MDRQIKMFCEFILQETVCPVCGSSEYSVNLISVFEQINSESDTVTIIHKTDYMKFECHSCREKIKSREYLPDEKLSDILLNFSGVIDLPYCFGSTVGDFTEVELPVLQNSAE